MKEPKSYTKKSAKAKRQTGLLPLEESPTPATKPGPLSLESVQSAILQACGWKPEYAQEALLALVSKLKSKEDFAVIQAAKLLLSLANAFPSKQSQVHQKTEVVVTFKPFARGVAATALPALPEGLDRVEDAEVTEVTG